MRTSKIQEIKEIVGDGEKWRGVYYHTLIMDNGDKINIGKKSKQEVGTEMNYEVEESGQEYKKAKAVNPDFQDKPSQTNKPPTPQNKSTSDQILWSVCLKEATALYCSGTIPSLGELTDTPLESMSKTVILITHSLFNQSKEILV